MTLNMEIVMDEPVKIYHPITEYEKILAKSHNYMVKEAVRYRELSKTQAVLLQEALEVVEYVLSPSFYAQNSVRRRKLLEALLFKLEAALKENP